MGTSKISLREKKKAAREYRAAFCVSRRGFASDADGAFEYFYGGAAYARD
jgi:hypothetical protein